MALSSAVIRNPVVRMEYELEQWGRWLKSGRVSIGYGGNVLASLRGSTVPEPNIRDDRAEMIDAAVGRLREIDEPQWWALHYSYASGEFVKPYKWARRMGISASRADRLRWLAVGWMLGEVGVGEL